LPAAGARKPDGQPAFADVQVTVSREVKPVHARSQADLICLAVGSRHRDRLPQTARRAIVDGDETPPSSWRPTRRLHRGRRPRRLEAMRNHATGSSLWSHGRFEPSQTSHHRRLHPHAQLGGPILALLQFMRTFGELGLSPFCLRRLKILTPSTDGRHRGKGIVGNRRR